MIYTNFLKTYEFEARGDLTYVTMRTAYTATNDGDTLSYRPSYAEEGFHNPEGWGLRYRKNSPGPTEPILERERPFTEDAETGVIVFSGAEPVELGPSEACAVEWIVKVTMPSTYSDVISFTGRTIRPAVGVSHVSNKFRLTAGHIGGENKCELTEGGHTWTFNRDFVAGQHVRVWWRPRLAN